MTMRDQAETLRNLMASRKKSPAADSAISVFLAPEVRKNRLFSPRELALLSRSLHVGLRIRDESDPLAAAGGNPKVLGQLAVLSGDEIDLLACYQRVKEQARLQGVKKMDILVCGVVSESEGRRVFARLFEVCQRFLDIDLAFVGAFSVGEKIRGHVAISKFLLHYQSGSRGTPKRAGCLVGE